MARKGKFTKIFTTLSEKVNLQESKEVPILMLKNIKINP
jgi:hypothetical protein